jgi:Flp pilus assembly protein TadD
MLKRIHRAQLGAFLIVISGAMFGCAPIKTTTVLQMPAGNSDAARMRRVAVLPFESRRGHDITANVQQALVSTNVGDRPYFVVVERQELTRALSEMRLQSSPVVDPSTAAKLGKFIGAEGIYLGALSRNDIDHGTYQESRWRCLQYEMVKDKRGQLVQGSRCLQDQTYNVQCQRRIATFAFIPKLVEVQSATVKYQREVVGKAQTQACSDATQGLTPDGQLLQQAQEQAMAQFRKDIAPWTTTASVALLDTTDGIANPVAKEKLSSGLSFAKASRMDRACELWAEAGSLEAKSPAITYNQGVCREVSGDLTGALELYTRADRMLSKPDTTVGDALKRVNAAMDNQRKAQGQMVR